MYQSFSWLVLLLLNLYCAPSHSISFIWNKMAMIMVLVGATKRQMYDTLFIALALTTLYRQICVEIMLFIDIKHWKLFSFGWFLMTFVFLITFPFLPRMGKKYCFRAENDFVWKQRFTYITDVYESGVYPSICTYVRKIREPDSPSRFNPISNKIGLFKRFKHILESRNPIKSDPHEWKRQSPVKRYWNILFI